MKINKKENGDLVIVTETESPVTLETANTQIEGLEQALKTIQSDLESWKEVKIQIEKLKPEVPGQAKK